MRFLWATVVMIATLVGVSATANEAEARPWRNSWRGSPSVSFRLGGVYSRPGVSFYYGPSYQYYRPHRSYYTTPYYGSYYYPRYRSYYPGYRSYWPGGSSLYYRW